MKESMWIECIDTRASIKISPDISKAKSLIDTAKGRIDFLKRNDVVSDNSNYIFEGYYSSALEMIHAIVLVKGYKVSNHICLGYYLRDVLKRHDLYRVFDDCRFKRNSLIYYGRKMPIETATDTIKKCIVLINELEKLVDLNI